MREGGAAVPLLAIALLIFVGLDIYGLMSGRLYCSPFAFLPVLPALFVRPWFVGLTWGFIVIVLVDVVITAASGRGRRARYSR